RAASGVVVDAAVAQRAPDGPAGRAQRHAHQRHQEDQSDQTAPERAPPALAATDPLARASGSRLARSSDHTPRGEARGSDTQLKPLAVLSRALWEPSDA